MKVDVGTQNAMPALVIASLCYCYFLITKIPKGILRVIFLLPVFYFFYVVPWYFSSPLGRGISSFFITWITSFKLLLFSFDRRPLVSHEYFIDFAMVTIFPLKLRQTSLARKPRMARYELVPLFKQPYLATSLQDFWGRRWNRMSSNILRETVYDPTRQRLTGIIGVGRAKVVAMITTLTVSGLMHELVFYYITCGMKPSWEVTWFFVLHGLCMVSEAALKHLAKVRGWTPVHPALSITLTVGFVMVTSYWLLFLPAWTSSQSECSFR